MLNICDRVAVDGLVSGVACCCQVHVGTSLLSFNSLELGIVEISSIGQVFLLGGTEFLGLQPAEVVGVEFFHVRGGEALDGWWGDALAVLSVDSCSSGLGERFSVQVLRLNLWHVSGVTGDVLRLNVGVRAAQPVVSMLGEVSVLECVIKLIRIGRLRIEFTLGERRLSHGNVDVIVAWLVASLRDDLVDVASGASINIVLLGNMTSIARQVLFLVVDICHALQVFYLNY